MQAVISEELENHILSTARKARQEKVPFFLPFPAAHKEDEDLIQALPLTPPPSRSGWTAITGVALFSGEEKRERLGLSLAPHLLITVELGPPPRLRAFWGTPPHLTPCRLDVLHLEADLFNRIKGIFDTLLLSKKRVAVLGLGSGGSLAVLELAKCGVGSFSLVDYDRLETPNISRHACPLEDVGRFKTRAVADLIRGRNPAALVDCYEFDVAEDPGLLEELIAQSDLVLVATDTEVSKYLINEACLGLGKPAVYAGAYERAFAGEVIRVIPGETACYACVRLGMADTLRSLVAEEVDYTAQAGLKGEPGLGLDIGFIALLQAKLCLLTLLKGEGTSLQDLDSNMIIWVSNPRPEEGKLYSQPLARYFARVSPNPDCPACGQRKEKGNAP